MLDFPMYEESNGRKEIGKCTICGCPIFSDMDRYYINGEYICESCRDIFMDNHIVFAEE